MDSEAKIILAFLLKRSGKPALAESEMYLPLSMDLGWFSTKEAQEFVTYAITRNLLVKKDGLLHPTFPYEKITTPVGFTPSKKLFTEKKEVAKEENIFDSLVSFIAEKTNCDQQEILTGIRFVEQEKQIFPEVAALLVARKYSLALDEWTDSIEKKFFTENTG
jgi:hypothetical protein